MVMPGPRIEIHIYFTIFNRPNKFFHQKIFQHISLVIVNILLPILILCLCNHEKTIQQFATSLTEQIVNPPQYGTISNFSTLATRRLIVSDQS